MARLEIDIALNNLQGATTGLKTLQDSLKQLSGKGVNIDVGGSAIAEAKVQAIQATTAIKEMVASANVNNATFLTKVKAEGIEAKTALANLNGELKKTETLAKVQGITGLSAEKEKTEQARRALIEYNLEKKKAIDAQKELLKVQSVRTGEGSIVAMRTRLNELRKVYDNLSESARNSAKVQNNLVTEINRINKAVSTAEQATGRFQRNVGNYSSALGNASGVTMEFNRIIQDAPFGMMGIGNNIQQLAANWQSYVQSSKAAAAANGTTIGTMGLLKGVMASMLTPANLLTLGISILTSAITAIGMASGKSAEEAKTLSNEFSKQSQALKNIISLSELHAKTERDKATAVSLYNKELGDTLGKVQSYSELEQKLIKSGDNYIKYLQMKAMGESLYQKSLAKTALMMDTIEELNNKGNVDIWGKIVQTGRNVKKFFGADINDGLKEAITTAEQLKIAMMPPEKAQKEIEKYTFSIRQGLYTMLKAKSESSQLADQWAKMEQSTNSIADRIGGIKMPDLNLDKGNKARDLKDKTLPAVVDYLQQIKDLLSSKEQDLSLIDLNGQARDLQELSNKYADFYNDLDKLRKKYNADKNKSKQSGVIEGIDSATKLGEGLEDKETLAILDKWSKEYNKLIEETYQKAGFTAVSSREKDLANFQSYIDKQRELAISYGGTLEDVSESMRKAFNMGAYNINIQWNDKDLAEWGGFNDKIQELLDKPFNGKNKESIQRELDKRIELLKTAYEKLARSMNTPFDETEWARIKQEIELKAKVVFDDESKRAFKDFLTSVLSNAYTQLFSNLKSNVEEFGSNFKSILFSVAETFQDSINKINTESINKLFEKFKDGGWSVASSTEKATAGLAFAGSAVSGLTKKTSVAGQGLGGALSGAAAGTAIMPGIGTAIGGALGLLSGVLSAKKQKKQEELQRKQLEEQKKANALLERMNALAYTSSIIGGQSQYGIISGVNRAFDGSLVATVSGRDLQFVLDNNSRYSGR